MSRKKTISLALAMTLTLSLITPALAATPANGSTPFADVDAGQWYADAATAAYNDGVMTGSEFDNSGRPLFNSASPLTMAEFTVMLVRACYAGELTHSTVAKVNWYNREAAVLQNHNIYNLLGNADTMSMYTSVTRTQMAVMIANVMRDQGAKMPTEFEIAATKAQITDLDTVPPLYRDSIAISYHLGIISGVAPGVFEGGSYMLRSAAATVYVRMRDKLKELKGGATNDPAPTPAPSTAGVVGTISTEKVTINKSSITTHAPIWDAWASQPMEIRNISDRDHFNAACQTIKDSKMILTQGQIAAASGLNQYYNYAVVAKNTAQTAKNVDLAVTNLSGFGGAYSAYRSSSYRVFLVQPYVAALQTALAPYLTKITPGMTDRQKAEICVNAVCDRIDYEVDGGGSWLNEKKTGDCTSFSRMLTQILSAAGIPNIHVAGKVAAGGHAWVQVKLDGQWYIMDGTLTENNRSATVFTFAQHESAYGYSAINNLDAYKVARALIDCAYSY